MCKVTANRRQYKKSLLFFIVEMPRSLSKVGANPTFFALLTPFVPRRLLTRLAQCCTFASQSGRKGQSPDGTAAQESYLIIQQC